MTWAPTSCNCGGVSPLTVAWVPTGMNTGVSMAPCAVSSRPRRAAPSVASTSKWIIRFSVAAERQPELPQLLPDLVQRRHAEVLRLQQFIGGPLHEFAERV